MRIYVVVGFLILLTNQGNAGPILPSFISDVFDHGFPEVNQKFGPFQNSLNAGVYQKIWQNKQCLKEELYVGTDLTTQKVISLTRNWNSQCNGHLDEPAFGSLAPNASAPDGSNIAGHQQGGTVINASWYWGKNNALIVTVWCQVKSDTELKSGKIHFKDCRVQSATAGTVRADAKKVSGSVVLY